MANEGVVVLLMFVLLVSGFAMAFNAPKWVGIDLAMGFNNIDGISSGIWIIAVKLVGLVLMVLSVYVTYNIIRG